MVARKFTLRAILMTNDSSTETENESLHEIFLGHEIDIEPNSDHYRGGLSWSVSKDDIELECGISFTLSEALNDARGKILKLTQCKDSNIPAC